MSKVLRNDYISNDFVVAEYDDETVVFNRKIKTKGRTFRKIKEIQNSLPTATIHYFPQSEFNKLKEIEKSVEVINEITNQHNKSKERMNKWNLIFKFLEI